ncbi:hypothetical protein Esti_001323 [Eimeria stiedai]
MTNPTAAAVAEAFFKVCVSRWEYYKPEKSNIIAGDLSRCPYYSSIDAEESPPPRSCLDVRDKAANQVMVCLDEAGKFANRILMAADFASEPSSDTAAASESRYHMPIVPQQQYDKTTAYKVKVGGPYWIEAYKTCEDFDEAHAARIDFGVWKNVSLHSICALPSTKNEHHGVLTLVDTFVKCSNNSRSSSRCGTSFG